MPELPEVETIVNDLRGGLVKRQLVDVELSAVAPVLYPSRKRFSATLRGSAVHSVGRRGKFILVELDPVATLVVHLGMSGNFSIVEDGAEYLPHTHCVAILDNGQQLRFRDPRRFGRLAVGRSWQALVSRGVLPHVGVDPLSAEFTYKEFDTMMRSTRRSVKTALLDQSRIAGLGNIYIDEICFQAGVRPGHRCSRLSRLQRQALFTAIPRVLQRAINNRGSSISDYRDGWSAKGSHQEALQVYGRAGQSCFRCGGELRRSVIGGRGTTFCPTCQR